MTEINDQVAGGYDPLQHHDPAVGITPELYTRFGVRIRGRDEVGRYQHEEGTVGDVLGGFCWPFAGQPAPRTPASGAPPPAVQVPTWGYAFPAVVVGGAGGEPPTPDEPFGPVVVLQGDQGTIGNQVSTGRTQEKKGPPRLPTSGYVLPVVEAPSRPDVRYEPQFVKFTPGTTPRTPGTVVNVTHQGKQEAVFLPAPRPLIAVNAAGDPATASLVFDETKDGDPDPERFARLHSMMRVVRPKDDVVGDAVVTGGGRTASAGTARSGLKFGNVESGSLALQLATGGRDGLAGYGLTVDVPFKSASAYGASLTAAVNRTAVPGPNAYSLGFFGGGGASSQVLGLALDYDSGIQNMVDVPTEDGLFKEPQANAIVTQLIRAGYPDAHKEIARPYDPSFGYERQDLFRIVTGQPSATPGAGPGGAKTEEETADLAVGALSRWASGPIDSGGPGCPHKLGRTHDGQTIYSDHLTTDTYFRNLHFDGPLLFEDYLDREPLSGPLRMKCHLVWNDRLSHPHVTGDKKGRWVIVSEALEFVTPPVQPPIDPRDPGEPPPPPGICDDVKRTTTRSWRASPFMQLSPGMVFVPQPFDPAAPDHRMVGSQITAADLAEINDRPAVLRVEAFGRRADGDWQRERSSSSGGVGTTSQNTSFPGGTSDGGIYYSVPEQDTKNEVNNQAYEHAVPSGGTSILFDSRIRVGYGRPASDGSPRGLTSSDAYSPFVSIPNTAVQGQTLIVNTGSSGSTPAAATFQSWNPANVRFAGLGSAQRLLVSNASSGLGAISTLAPGTDGYVLTMVAGAVAWAVSASGTTDFDDSTFRIHDDGDATKLIAFQVSGVSTGTTRTFTAPNVNGTLITTGNLTAITTVGTVTAGVWNGTAVDATHGGTNQTSWTRGDLLVATAANTLGKLGIGTSGYFLKSDGTDPSWAALAASDIASGTLAVARGGTNLGSYTAGDLIVATGTTTLASLPVSTDGFVLTLVAGAPAWAASGSGSFGTVSDAVTNAVSTYGDLKHNTSGTPAAGFGGRLAFNLDDSTTDDVLAASIEAVWTTATHASRASRLDFYTIAAATTTLCARMTPTQFAVPVSGDTAPGLCQITDTDTGIFFNGGVGITQDSMSLALFTTTGIHFYNCSNLLFESTIDVGSSGASRPRDVYLSGAVKEGAWQATKVAEGYGGTNQSTYTTGDLLYASAANTLSKLPIGTSAYVLTVVAGAPAWAVIPTQTSSLLQASVHTDTVNGTVVRGDVIVGNSTPKWSRLAIGTATYVLTSDGTDAAWAAVPTQTSTLLDGSVHTDTLAGTVVAGDIIYGNATPKWARLPKGSDGQVLTLASGLPSWATVSASFTGTLGVTQGGTGTTTAPGNGQLLIGNAGGWTIASPAAAGWLSFDLGAGALTATVELATINGCRLTTETGVPISSSDRTSQSTIYLTPYLSAEVATKDGGVWTKHVLTADVSYTLSGLTSGLPYDLFLYWTGSSLALEGVAWASGTVRATALARDPASGVWCKSGDMSRRYVGSFYTTSTSATEDSASRRLVFNAANRVLRRLWCADSTTTWTYTTAAWQEARAQSTDGTSRVAIMIGLSEDLVTAINHNAATNSTPTVCAGGIGIDSSTVNSSDFFGQTADSTIKINLARYTGYPGIGYHTIRRLEYSDATGATTWRGLQVTNLHCGMQAEVMA